MKRFYLIAIIAGVILLLVGGYFVFTQKTITVKPVAVTPSLNNVNATPSGSNTPPIALPAAVVASPIANAVSRVTKKPFGIYITPKSSPVMPERFTGFHTGVDFETTTDEQNIEVPIYAICGGKLLVKERASGYGGVINVSCMINGQAVTVIYGHLKLASVTAKVGDVINQGDKIGVLGKGYSTETDGERKHLHLGIHKGATAKLSGYVSTKTELGAWINIMDYLK